MPARARAALTVSPDGPAPTTRTSTSRSGLGFMMALLHGDPFGNQVLRGRAVFGSVPGAELAGGGTLRIRGPKVSGLYRCGALSWQAIVVWNPRRQGP